MLLVLALCLVILFYDGSTRSNKIFLGWMTDGSGSDVKIFKGLLF